MTTPDAPKKKGKGCLVGCLVVLGLGVALSVAAVVIARTQGTRLLQWGTDRLSGGGVEVAAPDGFEPFPFPVAWTIRGARSSAFSGEQPPAATAAAFAAALRNEGWEPLRDDDLEEAFAFVTESADGEAMTMDFFRKGDEVLLLAVTGADRRSNAMLLAVPRDAEFLQQFSPDDQPPDDRD